ncbi:MAG: sigma-70 family RNA polymerase sigma factor [Clostridiales bacterium]|nr:sigma-70 family RNA polymerase sigma factor [Clostridiales bacterium]
MTEQEFTRAAEQYSDMIFRLAFHYCGNRYDADDIVQTVLLKLLGTSRPFDGEEHLRNWLLRVTINDCKKLLRAPWRCRHEALEDYADQLYADSPEDSGLFLAVMELPRLYRVATYLYYYEGYSVNEISQITGSNPSTIRTRMQKARALLKEKLKEEWSDDE